MSQSLANVMVHLVFSTKQRRPCLTKETRAELFPYLGGILSNHKCNPIQIGGVDDHVHLLFGLHRTVALAQVTEKLKTSCSKWLKERGIDDFAWQGGYGAFSVGPTEVETIVAYIQNQEAHHQKASFQDEYRELMKLAGLAIDERYVWD